MVSKKTSTELSMKHSIIQVTNYEFQNLPEDTNQMTAIHLFEN